jgi:hypothetical protein
MAAAQRTCPEVAEMTNSSTLQITTQAVGDTTLLGDVSTGVFRPLVPIQHREAVFQSLHSILLGPPGYTQAFPYLRPGPRNCWVVHKTNKPLASRNQHKTN